MCTIRKMVSVRVRIIFSQFRIRIYVATSIVRDCQKATGGMTWGKITEVLGIEDTPSPNSLDVQRSPPLRDSKGTKTFVYYIRNLLQEGQNRKEIQLKGVQFSVSVSCDVFQLILLGSEANAGESSKDSQARVRTSNHYLKKPRSSVELKKIVIQLILGSSFDYIHIQIDLVFNLCIVSFTSDD